MSIALLVFGIVLSVIAAISTLILSIIALSTGKQRNGLMYGVAFIMSLVLAVLCITNTVERGAGKVKQGIDWVKKHDNKNINYDWDNDENDTAYSDSTAPMNRGSKTNGK